MPQVSVIIPLYNKGPYIQRALESVLSQTFQDYEVIVVDDGSTDDGPEVVSGYKDTRLRMIRQENAGPGAARNRGIEEAKGQFIAFLDADDEWLPNYLQISVEHLQNNPECDLSCCSFYQGEHKKDWTPNIRQWGFKSGPWFLSPAIDLKELQYCHFLLYSWAIVCKREVIVKYGGFLTKDRCDYGEDIYLWVQVMFNHKIYRILEPLCWYHSEASDLGPGRKSSHPLISYLKYPDSIRNSCCVENRELMEIWLGQKALFFAHEYAKQPLRRQDAQELQNRFPIMKNMGFEYYKLRLKLAFPFLIHPIQVARTIINREGER